MLKQFKEKRLSARIKGSFQILVDDNEQDPIKVSTIDLSLSGMQFKILVNIPLFREVSFSMNLPSEHSSTSHLFSSNAIVVRSEKCYVSSGFNIALTFIDLSSKDRDVLSSFLSETINT